MQISIDFAQFFDVFIGFVRRMKKKFSKKMPFRGVFFLKLALKAPKVSINSHFLKLFIKKFGDIKKIYYLCRRFYSPVGVMIT